MVLQGGNKPRKHTQGGCRMKEKLEKLLAEADRLYTISMDDDVEESAQDKAYDQYYDILREIANWLTTFTLGKIDKNVAMRMAVHKRGEILALAKRWDARR